MARIDLKAGNEAERQVLAYLEANASEALADKIAAGSGTLSGCMAYCKEQARKQEKNGVACIAAEEVFGWAVHYFEDVKPVAAKADAPKKGKKADDVEEADDGESADAEQETEQVNMADEEWSDGSLFAEVNVFGGAE